MSETAEYWKTHSRRNERKLRRLQRAANDTVSRLDDLADTLDPRTALASQLDQISQHLDTELGARK